MSCCTATISARGTMTRSIRHSRSVEDILEHGGFFGREAGRGLFGSEHELEVGARRGRLPAKQDARHARQPTVRLGFAGLRHERRQTAMFALGRFAAHGILCHRFGPHSPWRASASRCALLRSFCRLGVRPIGIRDVEPPQNLALDLFHHVGVLVPLVIVAEKMQKTVHRKMGKMMGNGLPSSCASRAIVSWASTMSPMSGGFPQASSVGNDSTFVASSMPRHCRLSRRIAESSVRTIASSAAPC